MVKEAMFERLHTHRYRFNCGNEGILQLGSVWQIFRGERREGRSDLDSRTSREGKQSTVVMWGRGVG